MFFFRIFLCNTRKWFQENGFSRLCFPRNDRSQALVETIFPSVLRRGRCFASSVLFQRCGLTENTIQCWNRFQICGRSIISTALVAAPLRRLSATIHRFKLLGWEKSLRIRPTNTSFLPSANAGVG